MPSLLHYDVEDLLLIYCKVVFLYFLHGPAVIGIWYLKSMKSTCCL